MWNNVHWTCRTHGRAWHNKYKEPKHVGILHMNLSQADAGPQQQAWDCTACKFKNAGVTAQCQGCGGFKISNCPAGPSRHRAWDGG
eukprot:5623138-Karenia_brevis.AAC.1